MEKVSKRGLRQLHMKTRCWWWMAASIASSNGKRYGVIGSGQGDNKRLYAHRAMYQEFVGPIPDGYEVDHLCRVTMCVRPSHLEAVTPAENKRRVGAYITHCKRRHEYTIENTIVLRRGNGRRACKRCHREREAARRKGLAYV
jgi:hypothetical protein